MNMEPLLRRPLGKSAPATTNFQNPVALLGINGLQHMIIFAQLSLFEILIRIGENGR